MSLKQRYLAPKATELLSNTLSPELSDRLSKAVSGLSDSELLIILEQMKKRKIIRSKGN